jgi:hypothetical protein
MTTNRRPRLVEEGKPITSMEEEDPQQEEMDHDLYSTHDNNHLHSSSDMYHYHSSLPSLSQQNQASSSLVQYLSSHYHTTTNNQYYSHNTNHNNIPSPKKRTTAAKLKTKFTIGSSDDDNDYHHETYDDVSMNIDHTERQDAYNDAHLHQSHDHRHISSFEYNNQNQSSHGYNDNHEEERMIQRMEIEDILPKPPLIVLDGANIAYAYVQTFQSTPSLSSTTSSKNKRHGATNSSSTTLEPNALGIKLAVEYFLQAGCRVQVVVPAYWIRTKQQHHHHPIETQHMQILHHLQQENILCCSPPTDDDDAYCIAIARREDGRSRLRRKGRHGTIINSAIFHMDTQEDGSTSTNENAPFHSSLAKREQGLNDPSAFVPSSSDITIMDGAFIVSNDLYRDAIYRDPTHDLKRWLEGTSSSSSVKDKYSKDGTYNQVDDIPRRISYSFADLGSIDTYGDAILDFVPNPRHALIGMIDRETRKQFYSHESFVLNT